jgi:hypothetical protein
MLIGQTDMFQTVTALGLRGRVGDQWSMCTFHQGSEKIILQLEAGYKRAVNSSAILFLQNWRGPYKRRPRRDSRMPLSLIFIAPGATLLHTALKNLNY